LYHFKKGLSSKKRKKISRPGCGLGTVLESRKSGGIGTEIDGGDLARFLSGRFYAKASNPATADTFLEEKFTFRKVGTLLLPEWRIFTNCKSSANANE